MMISSQASALVIDAGVGYALCAQDTVSTTLRVELALRVQSGVWLCAPSIWRFELTSILTKSVHFQQLSEDSARQVLQLSGELEIQLVQPDWELMMQAFDWTLRLKRAAAYDSFYLALARRLDCELWTLDRRLANASAVPWVRYVGNAQ
jgi:predicted nucleic acid-binding protein